MLNKKLVILIILILFLIVGGVFWCRQDEEKSKEGEFTTEQSEKQIQELEKQIKEKEKEIKEIEEVDPEKLADDLWNLMQPRPRHATEDQQLEGVTITVEGDKKIIKNREQGYSIEVPANLLLTRSFNSSNIELHDPETMCRMPQCYPVAQIIMRENSQGLSLKEFVQQRVLPKDIISQFTIDGIEFYKLEMRPEDYDGEGGTSFFSAQKDKVYLIFGPDEIIKTFKFE